MFSLSQILCLLFGICRAIALVVTILEDPRDREPWILLFHDALILGKKLKELFICPNQLSAASIKKVQDTPIQFNASLSHSTSWKFPWGCMALFHTCILGCQQMMRVRGTMLVNVNQWNSWIYLSNEGTLGARILLAG